MEHVLFLLLPLLLVAENPAVLLWTHDYGSDYSDGIYTMLKTADDATHKPEPSGVYLYQLKSHGHVLGMNKCVLMK
jgi:hypothetical protein